MPVTCLLMVFLIAVSSVGVATAEDQLSQTEHSSATVVTHNSSSIVTSPADSSATYSFPRSGKRMQILNPNVDATCFTMRTYVVQRDDRDSDTVHPVSYSTCQPSPRYEVKVTRRPVKPNLVEW